jgi:hypothetical protein
MRTLPCHPTQLVELPIVSPTYALKNLDYYTAYRVEKINSLLTIRVELPTGC